MLPPVAIFLNHDVISVVLIIVWMMLVIPLCILQAIDALSQSRRNQPTGKNFLRAFVGTFGLISFAMGASIVLWCLTNLSVKRLPGYSGPTDAFGFLLSGFGIGPTLMVFGWHRMALAFNPTSATEGEDEEFEQK